MTRSELMSRVKGRDTAPERILRSALWREGLRYRVCHDLPGRPDIAFMKARLAVFVDGCFWHGCPMHYSAPTTRAEYWAEKLRRNVERDIATDCRLAVLGWVSLHLWEHDLKAIPQAVARVRQGLDLRDDVPDTSILLLDEAPATYQIRATWFDCGCGSRYVRVLAVDGPGSLNPRARRRATRADLVCGDCGRRWRATPA